MAMKAMKSATKTMATKAMKDEDDDYQKIKARIAECNRKAKQKERRRRYAASPHAKAKRKEYRASPHGKAKQKEYNAKYEATPQGKAKRQATRQACKAKRRAKKKEYNAVYYQKNKARLAEYNAVYYYQKKKARLAAMQKKYMLEYQCTVLAQAVSPYQKKKARLARDLRTVLELYVPGKSHAGLWIMEILEQDALYLTRRLWFAWKAFTFNRGESD